MMLRTTASPDSSVDKMILGFAMPKIMSAGT